MARHSSGGGLRQDPGWVPGLRQLSGGCSLRGASAATWLPFGRTRPVDVPTGLCARRTGQDMGPGACMLLLPAGRIHLAQVKVGPHFLPCSITVLDQEGMDFLFGLDNLKRHQVAGGRAGRGREQRGRGMPPLS